MATKKLKKSPLKKTKSQAELTERERKQSSRPSALVQKSKIQIGASKAGRTTRKIADTAKKIKKAKKTKK